jgi:predicted nucleic acid-binding protein
MVIVDTSVLIPYLTGRINAYTEWLDRNPDRSRLGITALILSEVLQGIRGEKLFADTLEELDGFALFEATNRALAVASARNYRALRGKGVTIRSLIDCFTATFCVQEGFALLHNDRDFDPFEEHFGLIVVHPQLPN